VQNTPRPSNIGKGIWAREVANDLIVLDNALGPNSKVVEVLDKLGTVGIIMDVCVGIYRNVQDEADPLRIVNDAVIDVAASVAGGLLASAVASLATAKIGAAVGTAAMPGLGTLIGAGAGFLAGVGWFFLTEVVEFNEKTAIDGVKDSVYQVAENASSVALIYKSAQLTGGAGGVGGVGTGAYGLTNVMFGMKENSHLYMMW
jgi:hypothetical protein